MKTTEQIESEIHNLTQRIAALDTEAKPVREQLGNIDRVKGRLRNERATLQAQLQERSQDPRVSDHAVVRYLERKHGFDFEQVRGSLLTQPVLRAMDVGAERVKTADGTLIIKGRTIVTFAGEKAAEKKRSRKVSA